MTLLTAELVEELQQALRLGRGVARHVAGLREATLAGLLEYGCLRYAVGDDGVLPPLPPAVLSGALGQALLAVRSPLGLRTTGAQKAPVRAVGVREAEFHVLDGEQASVEADWKLFLVRFSDSAFAAGLPRTIADGLGAALQEMADNACEHARSPAGALVGYHALAGAAAFCVVDVGIGVLESLRAHPDHAHLRLHRDALREALRYGVSCRLHETGGTGFHTVFKSLAEQHGHLRFRSGQGCINMAGRHFDSTVGDETFPEPLPGFQVAVCCRTGDGVPVPMV